MCVRTAWSGPRSDTGEGSGWAEALAVHPGVWHVPCGVWRVPAQLWVATL